MAICNLRIIALCNGHSVPASIILGSAYNTPIGTAPLTLSIPFDPFSGPSQTSIHATWNGYTITGASSTYTEGNTVDYIVEGFPIPSCQAGYHFDFNTLSCVQATECPEPNCPECPEPNCTSNIILPVLVVGAGLAFTFLLLK